MSYIEILLGAGISGLTTLILRLTVLNNNSKVNQYINTINMLRADITILKRDYKQTMQQINDLQERLYEKDKQVALLEVSNWHTPFPYWLKDTLGKYIYVNKEFTQTFNMNESDMLNKTDVEIYGEELGSEHYAADTELLNSNNAYIIYNDDRRSGNIIIKWKRMIGTTVIGIAGQSIPLNLK